MECCPVTLLYNLSLLLKSYFKACRTMQKLNDFCHNVSSAFENLRDDKASWFIADYTVFHIDIAPWLRGNMVTQVTKYDSVTT